MWGRCLSHRDCVPTLAACPLPKMLKWECCRAKISTSCLGGWTKRCAKSSACCYVTRFTHLHALQLHAHDSEISAATWLTAYSSRLFSRQVLAAEGVLWQSRMGVLTDKVLAFTSLQGNDRDYWPETHCSLESLRTVFDNADKDRSGVLDVSELRECLGILKVSLLSIVIIIISPCIL